MDTVKIKSKNTKIIAHRGLSGIETENTAAAFVAAGSRSYFGIETDVHMTKDGKFVAIHDENISRVSGIDKIVEESTYEELKNIRLLSKEDGKTRSDLVIPLLSEYIKICKKYGKTAVLELKTDFKREQVEKIIKEIQRENYLQNTVFISFHWNPLVFVREILPDATVQFLTVKLEDGLIKKLKESKFDLDIHYNSLNKKIVKELHKNGIKINCWTVDLPDDAKRLISYKIDYLTTNILE